MHRDCKQLRGILEVVAVPSRTVTKKGETRLHHRSQFDATEQSTPVQGQVSIHRIFKHRRSFMHSLLSPHCFISLFLSFSLQVCLCPVIATMAAVALSSGVAQYSLNKHNNESTNQLISSPYLDPDHRLDLDTLDSQSRLFALALTKLRAQNTEYATAKYEEGLNLNEVVEELKMLSVEASTHWQEQDFYVVEFRSQLKAQIDNALLFRLDKESHREANISGGLLKYWFGEPDSARKNLATCTYHVPCLVLC
jgi:hypothetical protein